MNKLYTLAAVFFFFTETTFAQTPSLIKNVNTTTVDVFSSSFPKKGVALNGNFYFQATNNNGSEPWKTDGTSGGTSMLKDLASLFDREDSNPRMFITVGDSLFFFARGGLHLYKYKPSTGKVTEAPYIGRDNAYTPTEAVAIGNNIFFAGDDYFGEGVELMRYNTVNESLNIYDISPDTFSSYPHNLTVVGDSLFFAATDTTNGTELWMYDVNIDAFSLVQDIAPGLESSNPSDMVAYNNKLFFTAGDTTVNGQELWSSDGSSAGTNLYADIDSGVSSGYPAHKTVFNNQLFFSADDGTNGNELWMVDDINATIQMLADINPYGDSNPGLTGFKEAGSLLYFGADDGGTYDRELWATDGTASGTALVKDINTVYLGSDPRDFYNLGDTLIFAANDYTNGWQIWRSKGTAASTVMIQNIQPGGSDTLHISGVMNDRVYFGADDGTHGVELWKTGGTSATTAMVKDINYGAGISSDPQWFEPFNSAMYFNGRTSGEYYFSLLKTDATSSGTVEIRRGSIDSNFSVGPFHPVVLGSNLIFSAFTDTTGFELWKTDGTRAGTVRIKNINPGNAPSNPDLMTVLGTNVLFKADDGTNGTELWTTDGTLSGTTLLKDINSGSSGSDPQDFTIANGKLFFSADDGTNGRELWVSDGTTSGTFMLKNIRSGSASSEPGNLYAAGNVLYFRADDSTHGAEVWTSDGTTTGTTMVKDINVGADGSGPGWFAKLGSWVYFAANDTTNVTTKLWRTDGTAANTSLFYNVNFPFLMTNVGSKLVFIADPANSTNGFHIWSTNGTTAGTVEIEDFLPGEVSLFLLDNFTMYNNHVFYWIDDNISGQELWGSDGTSAGTAKYDIAPGPASSYPRGARGFNPLIFSADDGSITGREPWMLSVTATPLPISGLELNAEKRDATVLLAWKSLSASDDQSFELQRSANSFSFDAIGAMNATPGAAGKTYQFTDAHPLDGKNYYRVKQTAKDGAASFSNISNVTFSKADQIKAYPNPTSDVLNINTGHTFTNGEIVVSSMSGQEVLRKTVSGSDAVQINIANLPAGIYNAKLSEGSYSVKLVFVKR